MNKLFFTILLMVCGSVAFAQEAFNKKIIKYSLKDGLSSGFALNITQDSRGYMWFNTGGALNRFDGINFKVFKFDANNPYSLPGNHIQAMYQDKQGDIWVSAIRGIYRLDINTERFIKLTQQKIYDKWTTDVNSITDGDGHTLWFACNSAGFLSFNKNSRQFKTYDKTNIPGLANNLVITTFQDSKGLLWIGGQDSMVAVYHAKDGVILKKADDQITLNHLPKGRVNAIYEDHYHNIWIATSHGLTFYNRAKNKFDIVDCAKYHLQSNYFFSLLEDSNDNLLIGLQDGGLYKLNLGRFIKSDYKDAGIDAVKSEDNYNITERTVQSLFLDKDHNIWAGTFGEGIYMLGNVAEKFQKFQNKVTNAFGTSYIRYFGICLDADGFLWMGTDGGGIYKKKPNGEVMRHYIADGKKGSLTSNAILGAAVDRHNNLWFSTYAHGLFKYDKNTDSFINYKHQDDDPGSIGSDDVRPVLEDSKNNLWIGTNRGGLNRLPANKKGFIKYCTSNSTLCNNNIMSLCEDDKSNIFIGTYGSGVLCYVRDQDKFISYFTEAQTNKYLPSRVIYALKFYAPDKLLIGTEGDGLIIYNTHTRQFKTYAEKNGLGDNNINAIQADIDGNIWLSTNKGISKIEKSSDKLTNYDTSNGLQTGHFNVGSVLYSAKDQFMCFGGTEGYNLFYPREVKKNMFKPKVLITGLQLFGRDVAVGQKDNILSSVSNQLEQIVLRPDQPVFAIQYVALNYAYADKSEFAYQLVGLDNGWNYVHNQKSATYRYLEPGDYLFKVKTSNQDGIWFDDYASLKITILPPWYKTWWAYLFYIATAVSLVYYYKRYKTNQAKLKYDIRLAQMSAEKEKELNEKKLSFFTNISHEFRTPLTLIINPVKELLAVKDQKPDDLNALHIVYRNTRRLLSLVDQLLLFRKAGNENDQLKIVKLNMVDLCKEVFLCFNHQFSTKHINFEFKSCANEVYTYVDREKMEIVLFNLISNAVKFTPAYGNITFGIEENENQVIIKIKDSGCGIAAGTGNQLFNKFYQVQNNTTIKGGFGIGLYLVKTFIENHKGDINYQSIAGDGTLFIITLLKGKDHLTQHLVFEDVVETSVFLEEIMGDTNDEDAVTPVELEIADPGKADSLYREQKSMLLVEDNLQIRQYLKQIFQHDFKIYEADSGDEALKMVYQFLPGFIISDVMMEGLNGVELCSRVKSDPTLNHIPVILLTGSSSPEIKLKGIEGGADDYITKPFEKEMLIARVTGLLKSKNSLKEYFYNEITLKSNDLKVPADYKEFLDKCIKVVEQHLVDKDFCIKDLANQIGMSHSNLYKKIKSISGQSANEFIRFIRLRKAAEIFLNTDRTVAETAFMVGINDMTYFREQFSKLFGLNPSAYIKKFRKPFHEVITRDMVKK